MERTSTESRILMERVLTRWRHAMDVGDTSSRDILPPITEEQLREGVKRLNPSAFDLDLDLERNQRKRGWSPYVWSLVFVGTMIAVFLSIDKVLGTNYSVEEWRRKKDTTTRRSRIDADLTRRIESTMSFLRR